jgi:hypothetical protein
LVDHFAEFSLVFSPDTKPPSPENVYVCPLCTTKYFYVIDNEIYGNSEFSIDHLPPESIGGKFKVLTCKKCNNDSGANEAELTTLLDFGSVPNKRSKSLFPITYVINKETGEKFKGIVSSANGQTEISFNEKAKQYNNNLKRFLSEMHSGNMPNLQLFISSPDLDKIGKALLKSAYLACFVWWGYEFIYSKNAELLRRVLSNELSYPTRIPTVWHESKKEILPKGMSILSKNGIKKAFLFALELKGNAGDFMAAILIPNPTQTGWHELSELDKYVKAKDLTEFECLTIPEIVIRGGYTNAWKI